MFTTTTTRNVKMHGWTLPKGASVDVYELWTEFGFTTGSAYTKRDGTSWCIAVPVDALPTDVWSQDLPHKHYR
jgi:hypothetical protein